jgi:hypothetical protein
MKPMIQAGGQRYFIAAAGGPAEQRQDEARDRFAFSFEILVKNLIETISSGGPFGEPSLLITHLEHITQRGFPRLPAACSMQAGK